MIIFRTRIVQALFNARKTGIFYNIIAIVNVQMFIASFRMEAQILVDFIQKFRFEFLNKQRVYLSIKHFFSLVMLLDLPGIEAFRLALIVP